MKNLRHLAMCLLGALLLAAPASAEVVDRTIAEVNGHVITWSDLDAEMRFEALENGRPLQELGEADRRSCFEHLVQYRLVREQMQSGVAATPAEVAARVAGLRTAWKMDKDNARWSATLESYGLSDLELRELVANQMEILRFMEERIRPLAWVSRKEVEDYYSTTLAPAVMARGQSPEAFAAVAPKIRELLEQQKMNHEMDSWLQSLKSQSRVKLLWEGVR